MPDSYTKLLMHFDKELVNEADYGTKAPTTVRSIALYCDSSGPFLGASYYLDFLDTNYVDYASSSAWNLTGQDFAIDFFIKFLSFPSTQQTFLTRYNGTTVAWSVAFGPTPGLVFKSATSIPLSQGSNSGWSTGVWYHVAITRSGSTYRAFRDGTLLISNTGTFSDVDFNAGAIRLEYLSGGDHRIANIRLSIGTPRWTSNFTKPVSYHVKDSYTKFLLTFESDYTKRHNISFVDPTLGWDLNTKKFGTGGLKLSGVDALATITGNPLDFQFGTDDFTIDFWTNFSGGGATSGSVEIIGLKNSPYITISRYGDGDLRVNFNGTFKFSGIAISFGTWYHIAIVRSGITLKLFVNGTVRGTTSDSTNFSHASYYLSMGSYNLNSWAFVIDELRISKGIARWTANFVTPTGPYEDYKLSGNASIPCTLTILNDATKVVEEERQVSAGTWTISPLTNNKKIIMAKLDDGETICYGEVWPVPE